jgi:tyrosine-protein phosphatase SIW14
MTRRLSAQLAIALAIVICLSMGSTWLWDHRGYWLADNFREVEPGSIYAGGYQYPIPLTRIIDRYHIKTVVALRNRNDSYDTDERRVLEAKGVKFVRVSMPDKVPDEDRIARVEEAVAAITDPANQPVFVHCWAGCHRTGAVVAVYRVSHCGWTEQAARDELVAWGGTKLGAKWPTRILRTYCSRTSDPMASKPETNTVRQ